MKVLVLLTLVAAISAEFTQEERACATKNNFNERAAERMSSDLIMADPAEPNLRQFLHCVYEGYGMFKGNNKVDYEVLRKEMLKAYPVDSVNSLVDHCKEISLTDDDFENAFLITKCLCDTAHKDD